MSKTITESLFDPSAIEQLKEYCRTHDFTANIAPYDSKRSTSEKDRIYVKAKKIFAVTWLDQLPVIGVQKRMQNYSKNYPLKVLLEGDGSFIANLTADIYSDPEKFTAVVDQFFAMTEPVIEAGFEACAKAHRKSVEELNDEEILDVLDKVATLLVESTTQALMEGQQTPAIAGVTKEYGAHTDFNEAGTENHDKIDFDRQWDHSRTELGSQMLSLEEGLAGKDADAFEAGRDFFSGDTSESDLYAGLLREEIRKVLDDTEMKLLEMLERDMPQTRIAYELNITQSAVSKRIKKLREKLAPLLKN